MSNTVIKVENLSKRYNLGEIKRSSISASNESKEDKNTIKDSKKVYWAVKDISFSINRGEVVGVIGKNGAGKSTILKLLSKITSPTLGSIKIKGRIASLLEVGTGFHGELSGRDNIYLNGGILGMRKHEIDRKFDEIVSFSGVEQFIDTPVKRYSSGMYVRLAFAVAAHLEPDIMIIDEVLAVGDIEFQKKCLGKMKDVSSAGRTIIFVSHQMSSIRQLCNRGIYLTKGRLEYDGNIDQAIALYKNAYKSEEFNQFTDLDDETKRRGNGWVRFSSVDICNMNGEEQKVFDMDDKIQMNMEFVSNYPEVLPDIYFSLALYYTTVLEEKIRVSSIKLKLPFVNIKQGETKKFRVILEPKLRPREYQYYLWLGDENTKGYDALDDNIEPLIIKTEKTFAELGFIPGHEESGFCNMVSYLEEV